jgi:hypothetical protein
MLKAGSIWANWTLVDGSARDARLSLDFRNQPARRVYRSDAAPEDSVAAQMGIRTVDG